MNAFDYLDALILAELVIFSSEQIRGGQATGQVRRRAPLPIQLDQLYSGTAKLAISDSSYLGEFQ